MNLVIDFTANCLPITANYFLFAALFNLCAAPPLLTPNFFPSYWLLGRKVSEGSEGSEVPHKA